MGVHGSIINCSDTYTLRLQILSFVQLIYAVSRMALLYEKPGVVSTGFF